MEDDNGKIKQRFELLKMARELLNEEYINKRAEDHNKWVAENALSVKYKNATLPYPPFAPYPTDVDVVKAARTLYNFINFESFTSADQEVVAPVPDYMPVNPLAPPLPENEPVVAPIENVIPLISEPATIPVPAPIENVIPLISEPVSAVVKNAISMTNEPVTAIVENAISLVSESADDEKKATITKLLPGWIRRTPSR